MIFNSWYDTHFIFSFFYFIFKSLRLESLRLESLRLESLRLEADYRLPFSIIFFHMLASLALTSLNQASEASILYSITSKIYTIHIHYSHPLFTSTIHNHYTQPLYTSTIHIHYTHPFFYDIEKWVSYQLINIIFILFISSYSRFA